MFVDVYNGKIRVPDRDPLDADPEWSCSLDVADRGAHTMQEISHALGGITRQLAWLASEGALRKLAARHELRELDCFEHDPVTDFAEADGMPTPEFSRAEESTGAFDDDPEDPGFLNLVWRAYTREKVR